MALLQCHCQVVSSVVFLVSSLPTSVTTRSDCCFHWQLFSKPSYFCHISSGGPAVTHHFQCGDGYSQAKGWDALPLLSRGRDIPVLNEKVGDDAEATTGGGKGRQKRTRIPP